MNGQRRDDSESTWGRPRARQDGGEARSVVDSHSPSAALDTRWPLSCRPLSLARCRPASPTSAAVLPAPAGSVCPSWSSTVPCPRPCKSVRGRNVVQGASLCDTPPPSPVVAQGSVCLGPRGGRALLVPGRKVRPQGGLRRGLLLTTQHHFGGGGGDSERPHHPPTQPPWTPPPHPKKIGQIFFRASGQSTQFSGAFCAD